MIYVEKWKIILVIVTCTLGILFSLPNALPRDVADSLPSWVPHKQIALGLDLQGGAHLLYEVDVQSIVRERINSLTDDVRNALRRANVGYTGLGGEGNGVGFTVRPATDVQKAREAVRSIDPEMTVNVQGDHINIGFSERALRDRRAAAVDQAIEIVLDAAWTRWASANSPSSAKAKIASWFRCRGSRTRRSSSISSARRRR